MLGNWKTTLLGVGAVCTAVGHLANAIAGGDLTALASDLPAILAGVGLIFARDAKPAAPAA